MKTATTYRTAGTVRASRYPNAADHRYYLRKLVDGLLAFATMTGAIAALLFFMLL